MNQKICFVAAILSCAALFGTASEARSATPGVASHRVLIELDASCSDERTDAIARDCEIVDGVKSVDVDARSHAIVVAVSQDDAATLGNLWRAAEHGGGGPARLETSQAVFVLEAPGAQNNFVEHAPDGQSTIFIVIDNLHCKGCAKKIAAQLYAMKGVSEVRVDMPTETLSVQGRSDAVTFPWRVIDAVGMAKERPLKVTGAHGQLSIDWRTERSPKDCPQAQNPNRGGPLR